MKTVSADAEYVPPNTPLVPNQGTVPSIIAIPPQIATTVVWIAFGIGIGWYLFRPRPRETRVVRE